MKFVKKISSKLQQASRLNVVLAGVAAVGVGVSGYALATSSAATGASLYFSPSSGTYYPGNVITVSVKANTNGENTNAVQADFTYPTSKLQYQSIDATGSAYAIDASSTGGSGNVSISRGNISNVNSSAALVAKVKFKVLSNTGSAALSFSGSSALVRSSDSQNILDSTSGATYTIKEKTTTTDTTKPKTDTTTSKPKSTTQPDATDEKEPEEEKEEEKKEETPVVATDDDANKPEDKSAEIAQDKSKDDKLFLGLSNSVFAIGVPLLVAALAIGAIFWRNNRLGALPKSNHNFNVDYTTAQPSNPTPSPTPPAEVPDQTPTPKPPAPTAPGTEDPTIQPEQNNAPQDNSPEDPTKNT